MCKLSDSVVDEEFLDCPFKYKWCSVVVAGIFFFFRYSFACVRLALFSHAWTVILWHWIKFLGTKILHRNATCTNYSQEKFPCLKRLVVEMIWSLMLSGFFRRFPGYPLRFLKATLIQRWSTKFWWSYKRVIKVVVLIRFLYDQFFLLWLRTTAKEVPCSMSSPFSPFLFLVLWKENWVVCLEVEAWHHLLLMQNHCHQRSRHWFRELICFNWTVEFLIFSLEKLKIT